VEASLESFNIHAYSHKTPDWVSKWRTLCCVFYCMWQYLGWCWACKRRGYARFLLWKSWPSLLACGIGSSRHGDSEKQNGL